MILYCQAYQDWVLALRSWTTKWRNWKEKRQSQKTSGNLHRQIQIQWIPKIEINSVTIINFKANAMDVGITYGKEVFLSAAGRHK